MADEDESAPILLVSDVDDTLLGDDAALARFAAWFEANRDLVRLVYASGRFVDSIEASIHTTRLPWPDAIAGGVGTELRYVGSDEPFDGWSEEIPDAWDAAAVRVAMQDAPGVRLQPADFLSDRKVSYYLLDATPENLAEIRARLSCASLGADIIYSSRRDLDVVPRGMNKGAAASFIADAWGYDPDQVLVAGDSGNDLSMYEQGFCGIVIANAHDEIKAQDEESNFHSIHAYADGVLDGLVCWLNRWLDRMREREQAMCVG